MSKKTKYVQLLGGLPKPDWDETDETSQSFIKNKPNEDDALELVTELELATPVAASDGSIYTDENGVVYTL